MLWFADGRVATTEEFAQDAALPLPLGDTIAPPPSLSSPIYTFSVDHTQVGGSDLTDFPVLVRGTFPSVATVANGGYVENTDTGRPADFRFTAASDGTSVLDFEVVEYSATTGALEAWVRIPSLSSSVDTTFYLCVGDASVTTYQGADTTVWDASYKGVWHLKDGTTLSNTNSKTGATGTTVGALAAAGQVGGSAAFSTGNTGGNGTGTTDRITTDLTIVVPTAITLEVWEFWGGGTLAATPARLATFAGTRGGLLHVTNGTYTWQSVWTGAPSWIWTSAGETSVWRHLVVTYDGASASNDPKLYIDGVLQTLVTDTNPTGTQDTTSSAFYIGNNENSNRNFAGRLDEARLSAAIRSAGYVTACYNNQKTGQTFLTVVGAIATTYTFTGPSSGTVNVASTNFTVTPDGAAEGVVITPATDGTGAFSPASVTISGSDAQTFTYTPTSTVGSPHTLSVTNNGGLTDPASVDYTVTAAGGGVGYVLSLPSGGECRAANQTNIGGATALAILYRVKASWFTNLASGWLHDFSIDKGAIDYKVILQWQFSSATAIRWQSIYRTVGGSQNPGSIFDTLDPTALDPAEYLWVSFRYNAAETGAELRLCVRRADGTVLLATTRADSTGDLISADTGYGQMNVNASTWFIPNGAVQAARILDGWAVFNRSLTAAEEWAVPDPNGSGVLRSTGFSNGSGTTVTDDTTGATDFAITGTPTWIQDGVWGAPSGGGGGGGGSEGAAMHYYQQLMMA